MKTLLKIKNKKVKKQIIGLFKLNGKVHTKLEAYSQEI